jgi:beta-glucosidase
MAFEEARQKSDVSYGEEVLGCEKHRALALRAAREGITLLRNNRKTLPFNRREVKKLALIGKLGNAPNTGDRGSSQVYPTHIISPLEGFIATAPDTEIIFYDGENPVHAQMVAREADAVVLVVGMDYSDEGEYVAQDQVDNYTASGGDRKDGLSLHPHDIDLIKAVGTENKNSAVVLIGGSTIMITEWVDCVGAILMAYYPGQEGGLAMAEIVFGDVNPSGKLPFVLPKQEEDLPNINWDTEQIYYDYYHGYRKLDKEENAPLLPYGFGLSYTSFKISDPRFGVKGKELTASCRIQNTGKCAGDEILQMYIGFKNSKQDRPVKTLCGFARVSLEVNETKAVTLVCPIEKIKYYNSKAAAFELESMDYEVYLGTSSAASDLFSGNVSL